MHLKIAHGPSSTTSGGDTPVAGARGPGPARSSNWDEGFGGLGISARNALRTVQSTRKRQHDCKSATKSKELLLTSLDEAEEFAILVQLSDHVGKT